MSAHSPTLGLALLVAVAGGAGAVLRALFIHHVGLRRADPLPLGTLLVNASGSLLLGMLTGLSLYHGLGTHVLAVVGIGLCGGYTTWSTASWETIHLAPHRAPNTKRSSTRWAGSSCVSRAQRAASASWRGRSGFAAW